MPTLTTTSTAKHSADAFTLVLASTHHLVAGTPDPHSVTPTPLALPRSVDVLHASDITFTLSGVLHRTTVPAAAMLRSAVARQVALYFQKNLQPLGIAHMSELFVDSDDDVLKFTVSSQRCPNPSFWPVHVTLTQIDLKYVYRQRHSKPDNTRLDPFASEAYLPIMSALNRVMDTFIIYHLVQRYPLIFGLYGQKMDMEITAFKSLSQSVISILERSRNEAFNKRCRRILRLLSSQHTRLLSRSADDLCEYASSSRNNVTVEECSGSSPDQDQLQPCLLRLLRLKIRPNRFQVSRAASVDSDDLQVHSHPDLVSANGALGADNVFSEEEDFDDDVFEELGDAIASSDPELDKILDDHEADQAQDDDDHLLDPDDTLMEDDDMLDCFVQDDGDEEVYLDDSSGSSTQCSARSTSCFSTGLGESDFNFEADKSALRCPVTTLLSSGDEEEFLGLWLD